MHGAVPTSIHTSSIGGLKLSTGTGLNTAVTMKNKQGTDSYMTLL